MKNALICNYQEYFYEAVINLHKKNIIEPKYWLTHETIQKKVNKSFPNVYTHDYFDAVKGSTNCEGLLSRSRCILLKN